MINITLKGTKELHTFVDHKRDRDGDIIVEGETWTEIVKKIARLNFFNKGGNRGTAREELDAMIKRYESLQGISLIFTSGDDFDKRADEFFKALQMRDVVRIGG